MMINIEEKIIKNKKKNEKGITLIALVVTIVLNATRGHCEECIA